VAALIAGWHLPLRIARQIHYSYIVIILAALIVFNWMLNNANSSVLIMMLMDAVSAVSGSLFSPMFAAVDSVRRSWLLAWATRCSATPLSSMVGANALLYRFCCPLWVCCHASSWSDAFRISDQPVPPFSRPSVCRKPTG
jgi:hypothetical protein